MTICAGTSFYKVSSSAHRFFDRLLRLLRAARLATVAAGTHNVGIASFLRRRFFVDNPKLVS